MTPLDIDDAWDCDSIEERLRELKQSLRYPIDYTNDASEKIRILEQRKVQLGC